MASTLSILPRNKYGVGSLRSKIGRAHQKLLGLFVGPASVPDDAKRDQHSHRLWKPPIAVRKYFSGRFQRAMREELRSPIEQVRFARIKFRRALVLANRLQRIAHLFLDFAELVMERRILGIARHCVSQRTL